MDCLEKKTQGQNPAAKEKKKVSCHELRNYKNIPPSEELS